MSGKTTTTTVVMVPMPLQGHLTPVLQIVTLLSKHATWIPIHFTSTSVHIRHAKHRLLQSETETETKIHFHDIPIPPFPNPSPDPNSTSAFPAHIIPALTAIFIHFRPHLSSLLRSLAASCDRLVVIHDSALAFCQQEAIEIPNAESYVFHVHPAIHEVINRWPFPTPAAVHKVQTTTPQLSKKALDIISGEVIADDVVGADPDMLDEIKHVGGGGMMLNTFPGLEGEFLNFLRSFPGVGGVYSIGPLNQIVVSSSSSSKKHECLEWLDKQPLDSVVYVSFGSTVTLSDEQINNLAAGLKRSRQRFIWVLRDADRVDIFEGEENRRQLSKEFEEETKGVGMVVRGWAPQLEILAHPSTGAFLTHCGWNSTMESLSHGVAMITWPRHSDQPKNAMLVTEYLGAGVALAKGGENKLATAEEIKVAIRKLMVESEGKEIKKRARAIGDKARLARGEGGSLSVELDAFVAQIMR